MLQNMPCSIIKNPAGTFSYVGSIPTVLGEERPATRADILGNRTHRNSAGEIVVWKFPVFPTMKAAVEYAQDRGVYPHF